MPLPVYRHPALTVMVDDSRSFLDSLAFRLDGLVHKTFDDAHAAIDWLQQAYRSAGNATDLIRVGYDEETDSFTRRNASIEVEQVFSMVSSGSRFEVPAVVVVDYAMPGLNGLQLCEIIAGLPCRKILLTGQASEKIAIDAFNRKLIDGFISKSDPQAITLLEQAIEKAQQDYFLELTSTLKDLLARHSYSFLTDPAIEEVVALLYARYRFVEHYVFAHPEGIVFFDAGGNATLMAIATREVLVAHAEIAECEHAPADLLEAMRQLRLVPFFSDTNGFYREHIGDDWLQYSLPPQITEGRETYYWALFELPRHYFQQPIHPYEKFLRQADERLP